MIASPLRILIFGLSLSSSWGNGHATSYRALLKALAAQGHRILFLERNQPWYAEHRDLVRPAYCRLQFYTGLAELSRWKAEVAAADVVVLGSYVPNGIEVARFVQRHARGIKAIYDLDTPVTLASLGSGDCAYLSSEIIRQCDLYLSFTGGPALRRIEKTYGAPAARALYCSVDPTLYRRTRARRRWDLGYLGTYSPDRQAKLERLLLEPARRAPHLRFVVAGAQYPDGIEWPSNVDRIEHLPPSRHADFYSSLGWTLNLTRADMVALGYSPSVRLFEAAACATPIISDRWAGLGELFREGQEVVTAENPSEVVELLARPDRFRRPIGAAAQRRVLAKHTAAHRAKELEHYLREAQGRLGVPSARLKRRAAERPSTTAATALSRAAE